MLALFVLLLLALAGFGAPSAWALPRFQDTFTCSSVTYSFTGFAEAAGNTITEKVKVDGSLVYDSTFVFNGSASANTVTFARLSPGHHDITAYAEYNTNGIKGESDRALKEGIACPPPPRVQQVDFRNNLPVLLDHRENKVPEKALSIEEYDGDKVEWKSPKPGEVSKNWPVAYPTAPATRLQFVKVRFEVPKETAAFLEEHLEGELEISGETTIANAAKTTLTFTTTLTEAEVKAQLKAHASYLDTNRFESKQALPKEVRAQHYLVISWEWNFEANGEAFNWPAGQSNHNLYLTFRPPPLLLGPGASEKAKRLLGLQPGELAEAKKNLTREQGLEAAIPGAIATLKGEIKVLEEEVTELNELATRTKQQEEAKAEKEKAQKEKEKRVLYYGNLLLAAEANAGLLGKVVSSLEALKAQLKRLAELEAVAVKGGEEEEEEVTLEREARQGLANLFGYYRQRNVGSAEEPVLLGEFASGSIAELDEGRLVRAIYLTLLQGDSEKAASEAPTETGTIKGVWSVFTATRGVRKVPDTPFRTYEPAKGLIGTGSAMGYWASITPPATLKGAREIFKKNPVFEKECPPGLGGAKSLLENGKGECSTWSEAFQSALAYEGLKSSGLFITVGAEEGVGACKHSKPECEMLVKNWNFKGAGKSGEAEFPYRETEVIKLQGVPAQGREDPVSFFQNHVILQVENTEAKTKELYDPSYGAGPFPTLLKYQEASIAGFCGGKNCKKAKAGQLGLEQEELFSSLL